MMVNIMGSREKRALIDRLEYYMGHPEDEKSLAAMFTEEEMNILHTVKEFERLRGIMEYEYAESRNGGADNPAYIEEVFERRERERDVSFRLKGHFVCQTDLLLGGGLAENWLQVLTWYRLLKGRDLIVNRFWEFPVLETMLQAFLEELKLFYTEGQAISVLAMHSLEEITGTYFDIVFLLRRIEYGVEPMDGIVSYLSGKGLSLTVVEAVLEDARIFDKRKVKNVLEGWFGKDG